MLFTRSIAAATLTALAALLCSNASVAGDAADDEPVSRGIPPVNAIWQVRHLAFKFQSTNVYYRCEALEDKVANILRTVGAHRRVIVDMHCSTDRMVNNATAHVTLAIPTEATDANIEAATTFDSREQLVAAMKKMQLPTAQNIERFPATWQTISLLNLDPGDCDLLRALSEQVFPLLSVRSTTGIQGCMSWASKVKPNVQVTALVRTPSPDEELQPVSRGIPPAELLESHSLPVRRED